MDNDKIPSLADTTDFSKLGELMTIPASELQEHTASGCWLVVGHFQADAVRSVPQDVPCTNCGVLPSGDYVRLGPPGARHGDRPVHPTHRVSEQFFVLGRSRDATWEKLKGELGEAWKDRDASRNARWNAEQEMEALRKDLEPQLEKANGEVKRLGEQSSKQGDALEGTRKRNRQMERDLGRVRKTIGTERLDEILARDKE